MELAYWISASCKVRLQLVRTAGWPAGRVGAGLLENKANSARWGLTELGNIWQCLCIFNKTLAYLTNLRISENIWKYLKIYVNTCKYTTIPVYIQQNFTISDKPENIRQYLRISDDIWEYMLIPVNYNSILRQQFLKPFLAGFFLQKSILSAQLYIRIYIIYFNFPDFILYLYNLYRWFNQYCRFL